MKEDSSAMPVECVTPALAAAHAVTGCEKGPELLLDNGPMNKLCIARNFPLASD